MKITLLSLAIVFTFTACSDAVDMIDHTPAPGDTYCTYSAVGAGEGSFNVCILCPIGNAICGTIKKVRILREHHWFKPNEYDEFTLTSTGQGCTTCTGLFYWKRE
jgi:hypothetical protein